MCFLLVESGCSSLLFTSWIYDPCCLLPRNEEGVNVEALDRVIGSSAFWGQVHMVSALEQILKKLQSANSAVLS